MFFQSSPFYKTVLRVLANKTFIWMDRKIPKLRLKYALFQYNRYRHVLWQLALVTVGELNKITDFFWEASYMKDVI